MTLVYLAAALLGAGSVAYFVFAGFGTEDIDESEAHFDVADVVSLRSAAFFLAFFGVGGLTAMGLGGGGGIALFVAVVLGALAVWFNAGLVGLVRSAGFAADLTPDMFEGQPARVIEPVEPGTPGKISMRLSGRELFLTAAPYGDTSFRIGDHVVVVELDADAAYVTTLGELE